MQVPQAFGSASSYGKKYALGNLLLIDDTQDADASNEHNKKNMTQAEVNKAKQYLQNGGTLDKLKKSYNITPEIEHAITGKL